ncbi:double-stranded RNA binding motif domain-containing protein [Polymorphospora sp. NPDC050346]|uniref:double-stranded RNA binding motif domain-containing protein n=1 Tax=Polymorphospora sp. NPDC050346 TaxID=3155780 RepID=UPI0033C4DDEB
MLRGKGHGLPDLVAPALGALAGAGLTTPGDELVDAVRLTLTHRSYLNDDRHRPDPPDPRYLEALETLGSIFQQHTATIAAYRNPGADQRHLHREVTRLAAGFPGWAARLDWLRESAVLGQSLGRGPVPDRVFAALFNRLLGLLCLVGETRTAENLMAGLLAEIRDDGGGTGNPKQLLQESLPEGSTRFEYHQEGPGHALVYHAVVTDATGRSGTGTASNKKAASQAAALDFIRTHSPGLLAAQRSAAGDSRPEPQPVDESTAHMTVVLRLRRTLRLPDRCLGLFSQALIHGSWAHENQALLRKYGQRDNQALAALGARALMYEYYLSIVRTVLLTGAIDSLSLATPEGTMYARALELIDAGPGLLLGAGQAQQQSSVTVAAAAFQALYGAALAANDFAPLGDRWPRSYQAAWDTIAPGGARQEDGRTRFDTLCTALDLHAQYQVSRHGPEHEPRYRTVVDLHSLATGEVVTLAGPDGRSQSVANNHAAELFLALTDSLALPVPHHVDDPAALRFLVAHQATVFAAEPALWRKWAKRKLFGLHLADAPDDLLAWAVAVDRLVDDDISPCLPDDLTAAYAYALRGAGAARPEPAPPADGPSGPLASAVRAALARIADR